MTLAAGTFDPPTASDLAYLAAHRAAALGGRFALAVLVRPTDRFAAHTRARWLRELFPDDAVVVWDGPEAMRPARDAPVVLDGKDAHFAARPSGVFTAGDLHILPAAPGEAVKADPMGRWDEIALPARPAFVRRVRLFGAESSGKSTLAAHLAARYETAWVDERWRELFVQHGHRWEPEHVLEVATAQLEAEEQAARRAHRLLFCDTDALMTLVYAYAAFGTAPAWLEAYCDRPDYAARYVHTLLCAPDLPWEPDPVREGPEARARYFALFQAELDLRRLPYTLVSGEGRTREAVAEAAVDAVLAQA